VWQLNQVDVGTAGLVQDLDASHQVIGKAGFNSTISVFCGTSHGKEFVCVHIKLPFKVA
jgi:hypothetical protein